MKNFLKRKKPTIWAVIAIAVFAFTLGGIKTVRDTQSVATSVAKKKLPIYCVDTQGRKQVAISFDAAWGMGNMRRKGFNRLIRRKYTE